LEDGKDGVKFESDRIVQRVDFGPLISAQIHNVVRTRDIPRIEAGGFQRVPIELRDIHGNTVTEPLISLIPVHPGLEHSVNVFYSDGDGDEFVRKFKLVIHNQIIEWLPEGPPKLRATLA
jgi:hypothetical protein